MSAILSILTLSLLAGYPLITCLISPQRRFRGDQLELWLVIWALGGFLLGWIAFLLAELGRFSISMLLVTNVAVLVPFIWFGFRRWGNSFIKPSQWIHEHIVTKPLSIPFLRPMLPYWSEYLLLLVWGFAAVYLFFRPHQFITGGADAGVYINLSAHIANTGSILIDNELVNQLDPAHYDTFLRATPNYPEATHYWQPAMYVTADTSKIIPQFYHLHPVWQAVGYALGGLSGALYMTGYWALGSSLVIYALIRRLLLGKTYGRLLSLIGLAGLTINAVQVWFARYPTTEPLTQQLFWIGFFAFIVWSERDYQETMWGFVAGVAWGLTFLARIDTFFILFVPAVLAIWLLLQQRWPKAVWGFFLPLTLLPIHSVIHGWWWSKPYFLEIFGLVGRTLMRQAFVLTLLAGVGIGLIIWLWRQRNRVLSLLHQYEKPLKILAIVAVVLLAGYSWFIRPYATAISYIDSYGGGEITLYNHENLLRLGWYLHPIGILAAVFGLCTMLWQLDKRHWALVFMGILFSVLYIYNIRNNQHQIYAMRRYVPVVLPFFITASAWGFSWLASRNRYASLAISVIWLAGIAWSAQGFITHIDYAGLPEQIADTAAQFEQPAVVLFSQPTPVSVGDFIGAPLYFLHNTDNFVWRGESEQSTKQTAEAIQQWQTAGHHVYWVSLGKDAPAWPLEENALVFQHEFSLSSPVLEHSTTHRPTAVNTPTWRGTIYKVDLITP